MFVNIGNMPIQNSKRKTQNSNVKTPKIKENLEEGLSASSLSMTPLDHFNKYKTNKFVYLAILIIIVALLISYKKSWFVAAVVNGSPISNFEVLSQEDSQFRKQVLDQLINERLILNEAKKKGININEKDIDNKIAEIEKQYGDPTAFDSVLAQEGLTKKSIRNQIKISLALEKMYGPEITVTSDEIAKFIEQNKDQMQSSTSAELEKEATDILKSQKQNQVFSQKFQEIKKSANIQTF